MQAGGSAKQTFSNAIGQLPPEHIIFGRSPGMQVVRAMVEKIASTNVPVLILGESGTGKEILARLLHVKSSVFAEPFVKVNCPSIPGTLMESELFGYERGAFTGAATTKPGRIETANGGTLFLDEIAELDGGLQAKLLQVLQDGQFCRIGGQEEKRVNVRLFCATNRDLGEEVAAGTFREDLFYRINVIALTLVSLRERAVDIPELVEYLLAAYSEKYNCAAPPISTELMRRLQAYHWPGNIRQLENLMRRYVILGSEDAVLEDLQGTASKQVMHEVPIEGPILLKRVAREAVHEFEKKIILKVLQNNHWNRRRTARDLGISYRALLYKIRDAGIAPRRAVVPDSAEVAGEAPGGSSGSDD